MAASKRSSGQSAGERRRCIEAAALEVFSSKGYGETTIPDIAAAAGVAVGTIYNYYESKRDLLVSLIRSCRVPEKLVRSCADLASSKDDRSLSDFIRGALDWPAEDVSRVLFLLVESLRNPDLGGHSAGEFVQSFVRPLEDYINKRVSDGVFAPIDSRTGSRVLAGIVIGLALMKHMEHEAGPTRDAHLSELADAAAVIVLKGMHERGVQHA